MGLFRNYNKEGPGVSKDAPEKRGFIVFFETYFRNFWKFVPMGAMYMAFSILIIPYGIGAVGFTNVARNTALGTHSFGFSDFFDTIKKNWKQALPAGIINSVLYALLIYSTYYYYVSGQDFYNSAALGITLAMLFIFTIMNYYMWTLMITFKFSLKQIYKNSFKFVFINMKKNIVCFLAQVLVIGIYVALLYAFGLDVKTYYMVLPFFMLVLVFTYPAYKFLLVQFCVFPAIKKFIIDPYYEEHPDADIEKRRNLGIYEEEEDDEDEDEERVFDDNISE